MRVVAGTCVVDLPLVLDEGDAVLLDPDDSKSLDTALVDEVVHRGGKDARREVRTIADDDPSESSEDQPQKVCQHGRRRLDMLSAGRARVKGGVGRLEDEVEGTDLYLMGSPAGLTLRSWTSGLWFSSMLSGEL